MLLVDLYVPSPSVGAMSVFCDLVSFMERSRLAPPAPACPDDMALVDQTCVDLLPYPNVEGEPPLLGVSGVFEEYLPLDRTWDCVSLCSGVEKRVCTWPEWQAACDGTPVDECGGGSNWIAPDWERVARRRPAELKRLDQHAAAEDYPRCVSRHGVRMMTTLEEWVEIPSGYAFSRGYWAREGGCHDLNRAHAASWHGYSNACRCCLDAGREL